MILLDKVGQLNTGQFNSSQFNNVLDFAYNMPSGQIFRGALRSQFGWGNLGGVNWTVSYPYSVFRVEPPQGGILPTITLTSSTGTFNGTIRTDAEKPLITNIEFTIENGDCRDFSFTLSKLPEFPIARFSFVTIAPQGDRPWYFGQILNVPEPGDKNNQGYKYSGVGLSDNFNNISASEDPYPFGVDYGEIVDDIVQNIISVKTSIRYNPNKINQKTGKITTGQISFAKAKIKAVFDLFANGSLHDYGVDPDGDFFFLSKVDSVVNNFQLGFNLHEFESNTNINSIRNSIIGQRTRQIGDGGAGFIIGSLSQSIRSINKYRLRELPVQLPGSLSNEDMQSITDVILSEKEEPVLSGKGKSYYIRDYIERGTSRIILPYDSYVIAYEECNDASVDFAKIGSGDLQIITDDVTFMQGGASMRLDWTDANGSRAEIQKVFRGESKKLQFFYRGNKTGILARVGIGQNIWNEITKEIRVDDVGLNNWLLFDWDISMFDINKFNRFAIEILDEGSGSLNIDFINVYAKTNMSMRMQNKRQIYRLSPTENSIAFEWGEPPARLSDTLSALIAQAEEARFTGEVR